ncbi:MAG: hypothetical protein IJF11_04190 [Clostridia bacterium]|nr:hypothetical protein [Clostridia bacterium]
MSFYDWIYSEYPSNSSLEINSRYGILHILTIILCIGICVGISFLRKKNEKTKRTVLFIIAGLILFFELARRIINISRGVDGLNSWLYLLLPRPWCAIACWCFMASTLVNKRFFYNFVSMISLLCALVFLVHPNVGFDGRAILFENIYSIFTHVLLFIGAVSIITLGFADFSYIGKEKTLKSSALWELLCLAIMYAYAFFEAFALKIEIDPLMFRQGNDVQDVLGVSYGLYLVIYILFLALYFNAFYLINTFVKRRINKVKIN